MVSGIDKESLKNVSQPERELGFPNNGHSFSPLNKASPKSSIIQLDCGPTGRVTDRMGENNQFSHSDRVPVATSPMFAVSGSRQSLKSGKYISDDIQNAEKDFEPSSLGSISSLRAKRQRLSLATSVSVSSGQISTFGVEEPRSLLNKEGIEHGVRLLSTKEKISKFNLFDTCEVGVNNPKSSLSGLANKPSPFEDVLIKSNSDSIAMPVDVEGHLLANAEEITTLEIEVEMQGSRVETPKNFNTSRLSGKSPAIFHGGGPGPGKHMDVNPVKLDNPIEAAVSTFQYPSQMHKTAELTNMKQVAVAPSMFMSSPLKRSEQKISPSGPVSPPLRTFNQQTQCDNPFGSSLSQKIEDSSRTAPNVSQLLTPGADVTIEPSSSLKLNRGSAIMSVTINTDELTSPERCGKTASQESFLQDLQKELKSTVSYQTPMSNKVNLNFYSATHDKNVQKMECAKLGERFSIDRESRDSSHESAPLDMSKRTGPRTPPEKVIHLSVSCSHNCLP